MTIFETIILAIVEGLTEFLPISSTGHMMLTQGILGMESTEYIRAFTVIIQLGAILSVVVLYWKHFFSLRTDKLTPVNTNNKELKTGKWKPLLSFYLKLIVGCIPAGIIGILFEDYIDKLLSNLYVFSFALLIGGIFMLFIDRIFTPSKNEKISFKNSFIIGLFQCIAMIPGVSRSMATIVGGLQQNLNKKTAAEFSFFLAVPVMLGATLLKVYKLYKEFGLQIFIDNKHSLIIGNVVAFIVAFIAIQFFIKIVTKYGFRYFGYYRIIIGGITLLLMFLGVPLSI